MQRVRSYEPGVVAGSCFLFTSYCMQPFGYGKSVIADIDNSEPPETLHIQC